MADALHIVRARHPMISMTRLVVGATTLLAFLACSSQSSEPSGFTDADGGTSKVDPRLSFDPRAANRTCARDVDCTVLPSLSNCSTCCGLGAVAKGDAEHAYQAALDACSHSAQDGMSCAMACGTPRATCFEGTCVAIADPNEFGIAPDAGPACTKIDVAAGASVPTVGAGPACGAAALTTGFEDGLDPSWVATEPSAIQIDRTAPLSGAASLEISYLQKNAYLTIPEPNACGVRIAFTVRTHLLAPGITLARIVEGSGSWLHVRVDNCSLSVAEETRDAQAAGISFGNAAWPIPDDTPVRVVLTFDVRGKTMSSTAAPLGQPLPAAKSTPLRGDPSGAGAISAIELGSAPGVESPGVGTVALDDLVID